jgi:hypothetical protein
VVANAYLKSDGNPIEFLSTLPFAFLGLSIELIAPMTAGFRVCVSTAGTIISKMNQMHIMTYFISATNLSDSASVD